MVTNRYNFPMLADHFHVLRYGAVAGFFGRGLGGDGYFRTDGIADKNRFNKMEPVVAGEKGVLIDLGGGGADADAEYQGAVGDALPEGLRFAPSGIQVVREKSPV